MSEEVVVTADTIEPPQKKVGIVKVAGVLGILGGIALIVVGIVVWVMVSTQLRAENITVPDDAMAFGALEALSLVHISEPTRPY